MLKKKAYTQEERFRLHASTKNISSLVRTIKGEVDSIKQKDDNVELKLTDNSLPKIKYPTNLGVPIDQGCEVEARYIPARLIDDGLQSSPRGEDNGSPRRKLYCLEERANGSIDALQIVLHERIIYGPIIDDFEKVDVISK